MTTIASRLQALYARIVCAEENAGRKSHSTQLLAVSKAQTAQAIREAYAAGQKSFGENYLQEALNKQAELADLAIDWHFIGPIQSNKTQLIAQHFAWVHGIDRLKIAERLNSARPPNMPKLQVCIQVNVSQEASKSGVLPDEVSALAHAISKLEHLQLRGLMAIPAPTEDFEAGRAQFKIVRECFEKLNAEGFKLDTLSMGMSEDFAAAIAENATIVRIGSALFGARAAKSTVTI